MKAALFKKILNKEDPKDILAKYMTCQIYLTDKQLDKVIEKKKDEHGGCSWGRRK